MSEPRTPLENACYREWDSISPKKDNNPMATHKTGSSIQTMTIFYFGWTCKTIPF